MLHRMPHRVWRGVWVAVVMTAVAGWAQAQSGSSAPPAPKPAAPAKSPEDVMMGLDRILDQIAKNLTLRYNLNERQADFTRDMLHTRVKKFLEDHHREAWPALRELMHYQMNAETPPADAAKRLAEAAIPLYEEAKKAIREGNEAWRQQLSDEQRKMHDFDLKEMEKQFKEVEGNLNHWKEGQPGSGSLFPSPPAKPDPNQPRTPPKPPVDKVGPAVEGMPKDAFTAYVDEFIKTCQLDAGQTTTAKDILRETLVKVENYNQQHKVEFAKLAEDLRKAMIEGDTKKQEALDKAQKTLDEPIQGFFDEMVTRLVGTLRAEQKEIFNRTMASHKPVAPAKKPEAAAKPEAAPAQPDPKAEPVKSEAPKPAPPAAEPAKTQAPPPASEGDAKAGEEKKGDGKSGKKKKDK